MSHHPSALGFAVRGWVDLGKWFTDVLGAQLVETTDITQDPMSTADAQADSLSRLGARWLAGVALIGNEFTDSVALLSEAPSFLVRVTWASQNGPLTAGAEYTVTIGDLTDDFGTQVPGSRCILEPRKPTADANGDATVDIIVDTRGIERAWYRTTLTFTDDGGNAVDVQGVDVPT